MSGRVLGLVRPGQAAGPPTDEALCGAFLAGDAAAFGQLFERHRGLVFALMRRYTASAEDAADLTQQAFLRALEASRRVFGRFTPTTPAPFRSWLVRVALNLAKNHARQGFRWKPVLVEAVAEDVAADPGEGADASLERTQRGQHVKQAVLALPRRQREVLTLRVDGGLPFKDIAQTLGITENNAKVQFHHAVKRLKADVAGETQ